MRIGLDARPLAWGFGAAAGVTLAAALGAYGLGWGPTLAFPGATLVLCAGAYLERDGELLANLLRLTVGFTLGYLACAVPLTWSGLHEAHGQLEGAPLAAIRRQLVARWATSFLAVPGAALTLYARRRR